MKRKNKKIGVIIALWSVFASIIGYAGMVVPIVSLVLSCLVCFLVVMQVYHYQGWEDYNPANFWMAYGAVGSIILLACMYAGGLKLMTMETSARLLMGGIPLIVPAYGVFVGNVIRVFKSETSIFGIINLLILAPAFCRRF